MIWNFHSAGSLVFGRGSAATLGDIAVRAGFRKAFIVTDAILAKAGILDRVVEPLTDAGVEVGIFQGGQPEPSLEIIRQATAAAKLVEPDAVLGLGGGSNMDAAKLVAICLAHGGDATNYTGDSRVPGPVTPLICVPTTAGTGSEVSQAAVFTDTANHMKVSCLSQHIRPKIAVVDPLLTVSCPAKVTADSGIDALVHAVEAITAVDQAEYLARPGGASVYQGKNPMADLMAAKCIELVGQFLRQAVKDGNDLDAREGMALAATYGGLAFSNAGVALVHAMEYPVGGAVHVSHGAGNGLLLPHVMRYNLSARMDVFAKLPFVLGEYPVSTDRTFLANYAVDAVSKLCADVGIPQRLRDLGVTVEMLPGFADKAFAISRLMRVNPRTPTRDEILAIYRAAF
ncbi:iron-containing alcohol dehydrogenase [Limnoglobus roseus]|uniref:Alcohol dehydrogenase n=1 Tax=Limnoglobus roseus TaxID=2598579 RepID=A0A5C1A306_9BACT|nr:iron-containing alcohol dehydrogenase [Limnoglobus roseus]QEL13491.1 alcohol dehydrogenase [Limnoglobus roseus]